MKRTQNKKIIDYLTKLSRKKCAECGTARDSLQSRDISDLFWYIEDFIKAVDYAVTNGWVRTGVLQGVLRCGFAQASRIVEKMRSLKFISDTACSKGYRCLINQSEWEKEREALLRKTQSSLASRLE